MDGRKRDNDLILKEILKCFMRGCSHHETRRELRISRHIFTEVLVDAKRQYGFKTNYQLLTDYVKHNWWPGEAEKSGVWTVINKKEPDGDMGRQSAI